MFGVPSKGLDSAKNMLYPKGGAANDSKDLLCRDLSPISE